jgi:hypothetical protein
MKIENTISRRKLLASAPAAAGVPSVASALNGLPWGSEDDPIFVAIERHRKSFDTYHEAMALDTRLREERAAQRDPRGVYLGEGPEIKYEWIKKEIIGGSEKESQVFHEIPTGRMVPTFAVCLPDIDRYASTHLKDCVDIEAWKAEKLRAWHQWHGLHDGAPIHVAWTAWNAASDVLRDAAEALKIPPTTLAGLKALLNYVGEFPDDVSWTNEDEEIDFLREVMVAAAESLTALKLATVA